MITNELLKYGGLALAEHMVGDLNVVFDRGEMISTIYRTAAVYVHAQRVRYARLLNLVYVESPTLGSAKTGKPKGELKSLRPVVLLNSIHKVLLDSPWVYR